MKVGALKPQIKGKKLVFELKGNIEDKTIDQLDGIVERLVRLSIQRSYIRRSREPNRLNSKIIQRFR